MKRLFVLALVCLAVVSCTKDDDDDNNNNGNNVSNPDVPILSTAPIVYDNNYTAQTGGVITSDAGSTITIRGVCWDNSPNPTVNNDTTINGSGTGNFSSTIENIVPNNTYYVRAYATNSNGTGYGDELTFSSTNAVSVPDQNFEQVLIDLGYDDVIDGFVLNANISSVNSLDLRNKNISNLTGIEGFTGLTSLWCSSNQLV